MTVTDPTNIGRIIGLELFPYSPTHGELSLILRGNDSKSARVYLEPAPFAFLHYLALERQRQEQHWLVKTGYKEDTYTVNEPELWKSIAKRHGVLYEGPTIAVSIISRWAHKINDKARPWHDDTSPRLIQVPGGGRSRTYRVSAYSLNPGITSQNIMIHEEFRIS